MDLTPQRLERHLLSWAWISPKARAFSTSPSISACAATPARRAPKPPVEAWFRVIDRPVLRLVSVDLKAMAEISTVAEVFDFARDYLGLLKAAVIASGLVPPGMEGATQPLSDVLERLTGAPGLGIEIVSKVNDIPKGSRLAVSTSLLACLISACMRATGQIHPGGRPMEEPERRMVAARAILGEWLGGSGGGWQDSGGVWPGIKLIYGVPAQPKAIRSSASAADACCPVIRMLRNRQVGPATRLRLQEPGAGARRHGAGRRADPGDGDREIPPAQRSEWAARRKAIGILDEILGACAAGDVRGIGAAPAPTSRAPSRPSFRGPATCTPSG
jgi:hypothetical protein